MSKNVNSDLFKTEDQETLFNIKDDESILKISEHTLTEALQNELLPNTVNFASSDFYETWISTTQGVCRICLLHDFDESNKCITPCYCRGSMSKVHRKCLETWLSQAESDECEICKFKYKTMRITKYSILGSIKAWLLGNDSQGEIKELLNDGIMLFPIALVMFILSYSGITYHIINTNIPMLDAMYRIMTFCDCTSLIFAGILFDFWVSCRIQYYISQWLSFYKRSRQVIIIDQNLQENYIQENYLN